MKKLVLTCSMLVALVGFTVAAEAVEPNAPQACYKWVVFCDGIQQNASPNGPVLNGDWYHYDCANNTPFTSGAKGEAPISNVCPGGNGSGYYNCVNCGGFGDWHFVIDAPLDGTLDMAIGAYPGGSCWIDELQYAYTLGACTGVKQRGQRQQMQNRSSIE